MDLLDKVLTFLESPQCNKELWGGQDSELLVVYIFLSSSRDLLLWTRLLS